MNASTIPTPRQLFRQLDAGQISRAEFQAAMAVHASELIEEMEEVHRNPFAAYLDQLHNRRAAFVLVRQHGETVVREVLCALAELTDFAPARRLWNAAHLHVPLHCFMRVKTEPVFRIVKLEALPQHVTITIEHGAAGKGEAQREEFSLRRQRTGRLIVEWRRTG